MHLGIHFGYKGVHEMQLGSHVGEREELLSRTAWMGCSFSPQSHLCRLNSTDINQEKGKIKLDKAISPDGAGQRSASSTDAAVVPKLKGSCFYAVTYMLAIPLFVVMLPVHPFVLLFDKHRRKAHHLINKVWASFIVLPLFKVDIEGLENLPPPNVPAMHDSNHQRYLDIYILLLLIASFKFISKTSIFLIPITGWSLFLTGHIPLHRMDKKS